MFDELLTKWRQCDKAWREHNRLDEPCASDITGRKAYRDMLDTLFDAEEEASWALYFHLCVSGVVPCNNTTKEDHSFIYAFNDKGLVVSVYNRATKKPICMIEEHPCY